MGTSTPQPHKNRSNSILTVLWAILSYNTISGDSATGDSTTAGNVSGGESVTGRAPSAAKATPSKVERVAKVGKVEKVAKVGKVDGFSKSRESRKS